MRRFSLALAGLAVSAAVGCGSVSSKPDGGGGAGGGSGGTGGLDGPVCTFATTYTIMDGGGLAAVFDTATLSPPASFHYMRESFRQDAGSQSCDPPMPACGDPARIDSQDVESAVLYNGDVQAALAMTTVPFFGDRGVADGPNFNFMRADGRGFNAGLDCSTPSTLCTPIPPGIKTLVALLRDLIRQQLMDPVCSAITN